jgi:lipopolysaccharide/colanic/teichoic acid biosynthesis glycosyltransferase
MVHDADTSIHEEFVEGIIRGDVAQDPDVELHKLVDDPRVTPVGRILRRASIDELPQLINVIRGDMSIVGPRPPLPFEVAVYEEWHRRRLEVRPGMTGLWQVSGRSKITFEEMVKLDIHYIETWSPLRDLSIVLRTIPALVRKEAA